MSFRVFSKRTGVLAGRDSISIVSAVKQFDGEARLVLIMLFGYAGILDHCRFFLGCFLGWRRRRWLIGQWFKWKIG